MGVAVGKNGANMTAISSLLIIVALLGGWLYFVLRPQAVVNPLEATPREPMVAITPTGYVAEFIIRTTTPNPDRAGEASFFITSPPPTSQPSPTRWMDLPTLVPTATPFPWECFKTPAIADPCYGHQYVDNDGRLVTYPERFLMTVTFAPPEPSEYYFVTWTPTPAAERTEERFSDEGAPQR